MSSGFCEITLTRSGGVVFVMEKEDARMGILSKLFKALTTTSKRETPQPAMITERQSAQVATLNEWSKNDVDAIAGMAQRIVDIVNESLKIANESNIPETKFSRLGVAKQKLAELKSMVSKFPFLKIATLDKVELSISELEMEFTQKGYQAIANGNEDGGRLEKEGKVDEAIAQYEILLANKVDTPHTYRRLAILYKKTKRPKDELRVLKAALKNIPKRNAQHYAWFKDRLEKITEKQKVKSGPAAK